MAVDIEGLRLTARKLREINHPKADELDALIAQLEAGKHDGLKIEVGIRYRLEKFEGEHAPGMTPYEVIEGEDKF